MPTNALFPFTAIEVTPPDPKLDNKVVLRITGDEGVETSTTAKQGGFPELYPPINSVFPDRVIQMPGITVLLNNFNNCGDEGVVTLKIKLLLPAKT
jgi:hypothetical protein